MNRPRRSRIVLCATAACAVVLFVCPRRTSAGVDRPLETHSVRGNDGVKIVYRTVGSGVPIFLLPGGPGTSSAAMSSTHRLLRGYGKLVLIDLRGRGQSGASVQDPADYSLERDVADVELVRRDIGAERIIVYGHSYGSMLAMAYAIGHGERVRALIVSAGVHGAKVWQERNIDPFLEFVKFHHPDSWERVQQWRQRGMKSCDGPLADTLNGLAAGYYDFDPSSAPRLDRELPSVPSGPSWSQEVYCAMVGDDPDWSVTGTIAGVELLPKLPRVTCPTLVMGGRFDRITPPINQSEIARALPDARLHIFERSGHSPHIDQPLEFLDVVMSFLDEVLDR